MKEEFKQHPLRIPVDLYELISAEAKKNRRSFNNQAHVLLEEAMRNK